MEKHYCIDTSYMPTVAITVSTLALSWLLVLGSSCLYIFFLHIVIFYEFFHSQKKSVELSFHTETGSFCTRVLISVMSPSLDTKVERVWV